MSYVIAVTSANGTREWIADDLGHALEQHNDMFFDKIDLAAWDEGEMPTRVEIIREEEN